MRSTKLVLTILGLICSLSIAGRVQAVPVTGGTGPGGLGTTDGLSDLEIWVRADAGVLDPGSIAADNGDDAATWVDQSGNNFDFTSSVGDRPTFLTNQFNSLPAIDFSAAGGEFFERNGIVSAGGSARTVLIATQADLLGNVGLLDLSDGAPVDVGNRYIVTPEIAVRVSGNIVYTTALSTTNPQVLTLRNDAGGDVINTDGFLNGAALAVSSSFGATLDLNGTRTLIGQHTNSFFFDGRVAEIVVYDRSLSDPERIVSENYLNSKYDLDNDGAIAFMDDFYAGDLAANGDYDFDVFGIGNDGTTPLVMSGSEGLGIEATGGTLGSGEFVLAGHKTTTNGLTTADVETGRWERVWYIDTNEGSVAATLGFGWSDSGLVEPFDPSFNTLYFSLNDPFSFSPLASASSIVGDQVFFNLSSANFQSGYYTLGLAPHVPEPSSFLLLGLGALGLLRHTRRRRHRA